MKFKILSSFAMKKPVAFSIIAVFILFFGISKFSRSQELFYKHFEGTVGTNIHMVADLTGLEDKLNGYYYYYFKEEEGSESWTHYGKSLAINGIIKSGYQLEFSEFEPSARGSIFKGVLKEGKITGIWESEDEKKSLPFELVEMYPEGSVAFDIFYLDKEQFLFNDNPDAKATVELCLALPNNNLPQAVHDSIYGYIVSYFFGKDPGGTDPNALLRAESEIYFKNYRSTNKDLYTEGAMSFNWEKIESVIIQHNENNLLSLEFFDYGYTGGAHGFGISKFKAFDLRDGHAYRLDEIFRQDYQNDLRDIVNSQARTDYFLSGGQSLQDAGFFLDNIEPSDNFYVTKEGIGFFYNQYEVAPFTMGPIDIFVPFSKLKKIMDPGSTLYYLTDRL